MPKSNLEGIIILVVVLIILFVFGSFLLLDKLHVEVGKEAIFATNDNYLPVVTCDVGRFVGEYGDLVKRNESTQLDFSGTNYFIANFDRSPELLFRLDKDNVCRIVEDPQEATGIRQMYLYHEQIQNFDINFYHKMRWCTKRAAGADKVCKITSAVSNIFESPVVSIVSYVPDVIFDKVSDNLKKDGYESVAVLVGGTRFVKVISGSTVVSVTIDLIKDTSCSLGDPYQLGIFNESNGINQTYANARKNIFVQSTIIDIESANKRIAIYASLDKKNLNVFNSFIYTINDYFDGDKDCIGFDYENKAISFNTDLNYVVTAAEPWVNGYLPTLLESKTSALSDLNNVEVAKSKSYSWDKLLPIQKYLEYAAYKEKSKEAFDSQLYGKVAELSKADVNYYNSYWPQVTLWDYGFGGVIWVVIIGLVSLFGYLLWLIIRDIDGGGYYAG